MRRPEIASTQKRNRARLRLKKGPGRQIRRTQREISPRVPAERLEAASNSQQTSAAREAPTSATAEVAAREPARCVFGAVRVGALLARLRLHLQTDRFLAVHREDTMWEAGCMAAVLALAEVVAGMQEAELGALLAPHSTQEGAAWETPALVPVPGVITRSREATEGSAFGLAPNSRSAFGRELALKRPELQPHGPTLKNQGWGTRPSLANGTSAPGGTTTLARCSRELKRGAR